jgi:hypothetical protein
MSHSYASLHGKARNIILDFHSCASVILRRNSQEKKRVTEGKRCVEIIKMPRETQCCLMSRFDGQPQPDCLGYRNQG